MSLQRRLLWYLAICAPLVWGIALAVSVRQARLEVDEMFDTELIRLARQVQLLVRKAGDTEAEALPAAPRKGTAEAGEGDLRDLAIAIWDREGHLLLSDREGVDLPFRPERVGFFDERIRDAAWRVYYLPSATGTRLVAAGQRVHERDELVLGLTASQIVPWLLVLPVLLVVMAWAVRRALMPLRVLSDELGSRHAEELSALPDAAAPVELRPLLASMNGLFARIEALLMRERRFTADAAHELRTPLAALRAQWDVVRGAAVGPERAQAEAKLTAGMERMQRLVAQLLALARLESASAEMRTERIQWAAAVEEAYSDGLELADRRGIELACEWPPEGVAPLPLLGEQPLVVVMLRNLVDNAVRYATPGTVVTVRFSAHALVVENDAEPLPPATIARLGERFYRPDGQAEAGSGLGISIVRRIADLHGLVLSLAPGPGGRGLRVTLAEAGA